MFIPIAGVIIGTAVGIYGTSRGWSTATCFWCIVSLSLAAGAFVISLDEFCAVNGIESQTEEQ